MCSVLCTNCTVLQAGDELYQILHWNKNKSGKQTQNEGKYGRTQEESLIP